MSNLANRRDLQASMPGRVAQLKELDRLKALSKMIAAGVATGPR
jgi:hypothetical protein